MSLLLLCLRELTYDNIFQFYITLDCAVLFLFIEVYHVVEFTQTNTVSVVSSLWMLGSDKCCYPPKSYGNNKKVNKSARMHVGPEDNWDVYDVRKIKTKGMLIVHFWQLCFSY